MSGRPFLILPDFRNLSIALQWLELSMLLLIAFAYIEWFKFSIPLTSSMLRIYIWWAPATLGSLVLLMLLNNPLHYLPHRLQILLTFFLLNLSAIFFYKTLASPDSLFSLQLLLANVVSLLGMRYYTLQKLHLMPVLAESRLIALSATIRPHFLFNSVNTAISLIRLRPEDAEEVLQNLADLFRAILKSRNHSTLEEEIVVARSYLSIEQIRLGSERLQIIWNIDAPGETVTPYLFLQPLLENAIYHGVETLIEPQPVMVNIIRKGAWIFFHIANTFKVGQKKEKKKTGHRMALENLSERLNLLFGQDAYLTHRAKGDQYLVDIRIPYYTHLHIAGDH